MELRPSSLVAGALLLLVLGCPKPPPPPPLPRPTPEEQEREALEPKVRELSRRAEGLLRDQDELVWKSWTEGAPVDIGKTYEPHPELFSRDHIRAIERLRALSQDATEQRTLTRLHVHFVGEHLAKELADVTDAIANLQASMTFTAAGKEVAWRELDRVLANERAAPQRRAIYAAATPSVQRLAQSIQRKDERVGALLRELGYESYAAFTAELRQADLERLGALASQVLDVTDAAWKQALAELSKRELGVEASELSRADFPRLFRATSVDGFFPKDQVLPRALQTLAGLGIQADGLPQLRIDSAERPGKNPRALTLAVVVPGDVRLSLKPAPGVRPQAQVLHELGHALHYAHSAPLPFELGKLGDGTVAEAMGELFQDLLADPVWLEQYAGLSGDKARDYLWVTSAHELFQLRRAAGRILYELQLHGPAPVDPRPLYGALMSRAYGVPVAGLDLERAGTEREDFLESADQFRAAFLAGQLQGQLKARFGPSWWNSKDAGAFLKGLWARGNAVTAREVAESFGDGRIKPDVLLLRLSAALQLPITLPAETPDAEPSGTIVPRLTPSSVDGGS